MILPILAVILLILLLIGLFFAKIIVYPKRFGVQESYDIEKNNQKLIEDEYQSWAREEINISSRFGYSLAGIYFPIPGSKRCVVLSHGITYTRYGSVKYMSIFRKLGFNILIYDLRYHGSSGGKNTTFGFYEKHDLATLFDWLEEREGPDIVIGTHGESMGAAISLQHAAIDSRVAFVVEDCSYSDLPGQIAYRLKVEYHLGRFPALYLASLGCKILTGIYFHQVSPLQDVARINVPVLFIHGAEDDYIPPGMARKLYEAKVQGARQLYLAPQAAHAEAYWKNQDEYSQIVEQFLIVNKII